MTSRLFVRDCSMVAPYALLLFGGRIDVQLEAGTITVDGWIPFEAQPRVAALVRGLRRLLDGLLEQKLATPRLQIGDDPTLDLIARILRRNGL